MFSEGNITGSFFGSKKKKIRRLEWVDVQKKMFVNL